MNTTTAVATEAAVVPGSECREAEAAFDLWLSGSEVPNLNSPVLRHLPRCENCFQTLRSLSLLYGSRLNEATSHARRSFLTRTAATIHAIQKNAKDETGAHWGPCSTPGAVGVVTYDLRGAWDLIYKVGMCRHIQKLNYDSTRNMYKLPHLVEIAGEAVYSMATGLPVNVDLDRRGDQGIDFDGRVDVKGCSYCIVPILKHQPTKKDRARRTTSGPIDLTKDISADWYVLVAVCLTGRWGYIAGHESREAVASAPFDDFTHGQQHAIAGSSLRPGLPPPHAGLDAWPKAWLDAWSRTT